MPKINNNKEKNIIISSIISPKSHEQLLEYCKKIDRNISYVIRKQIDNLLNDQENKN
jgi:hypothetical protein